MAINRPITASTQIGIVTGVNEGYANQTDFVAALKPLMLAGLTDSGSGSPTTAPVDDVPPFYVDTSTSPYTLYWWDSANTTWSALGDGTATTIVIPNGSTSPTGTPSGIQLYIENGVNGGLWYFNRFPLPGAWVKLATDGDLADLTSDLADLATLVDTIHPCTATPATVTEITDMTDSPATLRVAVCNSDGSPSVVRLNGAQLVDVLGVATLNDLDNLSACTAPAATASAVAAMTANPATLKLLVCNDDGTPSLVSITGPQLYTILGLATTPPPSGLLTITGLKQQVVGANVSPTVPPAYTSANFTNAPTTAYNGNTNNAAAASMQVDEPQSPGFGYFAFTIAESTPVTEVTMYPSSDLGFNADVNGTPALFGSMDGVNWTSISTTLSGGPFTSNTPVTMTSTNTVAYDYYAVRINLDNGTGGATSTKYFAEIEVS